MILVDLNIGFASLSAHLRNMIDSLDLTDRVLGPTRIGFNLVANKSCASKINYVLTNKPELYLPQEVVDSGLSDKSLLFLCVKI